MAELTSDLPFRVPPALDETNEFFWTSGADGRLRFLRCQTCGYFLHPPSPRCPTCGGFDLAPEPVSGRASVYSFTVNHQSWDGSAEPYLIAIVELVEQADLRLTTNLVEVRPDEVHIAMDVEVSFEEQNGIFWPLFRPVGP
jgi:uncharacterized OB-fold protein